jgi:hypothetical protein
MMKKMKTHLQRTFESNLELTKRLLGRKSVITAYLMTKCDKEAIDRGVMFNNGVLRTANINSHKPR